MLQTHLDKLIYDFHDRAKKPFVSGKFGDNWKEFAEKELTPKKIIEIAWIQGRKNEMLRDLCHKLNNALEIERANKQKS